MGTTQMDIDAFVNIVAGNLGITYTQEQKDYIKNFNHTMICFASPGTGKTMSAVGGLLAAELYYRYPGNEIYAMSFTNMATGELAARHLKACRKLRIRSTINFTTLHKLCSSLLRDNAHLLGITNLSISNDISMQRWVDLISESLQKKNYAVPVDKIPKVVRAVQKLNSSLTFDKVNVEESMAFKRCNVNYEVFNYIRGVMFSFGILIQKIPVSDILLCTLLLLLKFPEVGEAFSEKCKLMLVDESQDLSLLQLKIISLLAKKVIMIGDMKQQIYAFNGACAEITQQFYKLYPDADTKYLTQSFRCKNEIADYATQLIMPNGISAEEAEFTGVGAGGEVTITNQLDLDSIVSEICEKYFNNNHVFEKDILFLFRNNASAIPIVERLYKSKLPFRVNSYIKAYEIPVISDLTKLAMLAKDPDVPANVEILCKVISEFSQYTNVEANPLYKIMKKTGLSAFDISYQYKNPEEAAEVFNILIEAHSDMEKGAFVADIFNKFWKMYFEHWLKRKEFMLEYNANYYLNLVHGLLGQKTLPMFLQIENEKEAFIKECVEHDVGIRCYTMHAAKGLEADIVYILDAENNILPNNRRLEDAVQLDCAYEASKSLRNERSLVYVATTRAKEKLVIQYSEDLSPLLDTDRLNTYKEYDDIYTNNQHMEMDIESFIEFCQEFVYDKLE